MTTSLHVMVRDSAGNLFNPRVGGYKKPSYIFQLAKKFPIVEVREHIYGDMVYGFYREQRCTPEEIQQKTIQLLRRGRWQ